MDTLRTYLTGWYRSTNPETHKRKKKKPLEHGRFVGDLATFLGMSEAECAEAFEVDIYEEYLGERTRQIKPGQWWLRQGSVCDLVHRVHDLRVTGHRDDEIPDLLLQQEETRLRKQGRSDHEIEATLADARAANLTTKDIWWIPIQHAQHCKNSRC